ncbi:MAG: NYN domain-containing protein [Candidatus Omnitrophica bacterium]|nr:NYN domain-containing protein [Candidatus Omnitrophota bacterium]
MAIYIIDAFNLFHKIKNLKKSNSPHQDLIIYIHKYKLTGSQKNKVIIVFDGYKQQSFINYNFEILFSYQNSADNVIKNLIDKYVNKNEVFVVSDDIEIRNFAKSRNARSIKIEEFLEKKEKHKTAVADDKNISYTLQREITEELKKIWLKGKDL